MCTPRQSVSSDIVCRSSKLVAQVVCSRMHLLVLVVYTTPQRMAPRTAQVVAAEAASSHEEATDHEEAIDHRMTLNKVVGSPSYHTLCHIDSSRHLFCPLLCSVSDFRSLYMYSHITFSYLTFPWHHFYRLYRSLYRFDCRYFE